MVGRSRVVLLVLTALMAAGVLAPLSAAFGTVQSTETSPGFLYLTSDIVDQAESLDCGSGTDRMAPAFGMSTEAPRSHQADRVYDRSWTAHSVDCTVAFEYEIDEPFSLSRGASVSVWAQCHHPTPIVPTPTRNGTSVISWSFMLERNGVLIERYETFEELGAGVCLGTFAPAARFNGVFQPAEIVFERGDILTLHSAIFNIVSPGNTTHYLVGGLEAPSALFGEGFPGQLKAAPTGRLAVSAPDATGATGPGNATTHVVEVTNTGSATRGVRLSVSGPEPWIADTEPRFLQLDGGESATIDVEVAAPPSLQEGQAAVHRVNVTSQEETVVFDIVTDVLAGTGEASALFAEEPADEPQGASELTAVNVSGPASQEEQTGPGEGWVGVLAALWEEIVATLVVVTLAGLVHLLR